MAMAALPDYLRDQDLRQASPGLRFGMYLKVWGVGQADGSLTRMPNWTTVDWVLGARGEARERRMLRSSTRVQALREALVLNPSDRQRQAALVRRQRHLGARVTGPQMLILDAESVSPFTTGMGQEHPLESGFAFLHPHGLPYLPGSGVKGVLRQAARELASGRWPGGTHGWSDERKHALFGRGDGDTHALGQGGALWCWDVVPEIAGSGNLQVDGFMPHQNRYHRARGTAARAQIDSPNDCEEPVPISFVTLPPGCRFTFHFQCDLPLLRQGAYADLADPQVWQPLVRAAAIHAFTWLGFGARTSLGYGAMQIDEVAARYRAEAAWQREHQQAIREVGAEQLLSAGPGALERTQNDAVVANQERIALFRQVWEAARRRHPIFDPNDTVFMNARRAFLEEALTWGDPGSRHDAAELLEATHTAQWGRPKKTHVIEDGVGKLRGDAPARSVRPLKPGQ